MSDKYLLLACLLLLLLLAVIPCKGACHLTCILQLQSS
jgi:hypothetical protein